MGKNHAAYMTIGIQFEAYNDQDVDSILKKYNLKRNNSQEDCIISRNNDPEGVFRFELWNINENTYILGKNVYDSVKKKVAAVKVDLSEIKETLEDVCEDIPDAEILLFSLNLT